MKKIVSKILELILPKEIYKNRRANKFFIFYSNFELFFITFIYRFSNTTFLFLPSRHLGAILLLNKLSKIFKKKNQKFFLWDASLLGAARNQNAIAGSASDLDIGIIFNQKKHLKFLKSFENEFRLRFHHNFNSLQLFHKFGLVDISLLNLKRSRLSLTVDIPKKKRINDNYKIRKFSYNLRDFQPFRTGKIYSKKYFIPKKSQKILKKIYGKNWRIPDKKEQVYFT